jgi:hypothetical protein
MENKILKLAYLLTLIFVPVYTFARFEKTTVILAVFTSLIKFHVIPLLFVIALLLFFWGIVKYLWSVGAGKEEGKKIMIWGIVALFVMSSIWGLVSFIGTSLGITAGTGAPNIPTISR